MTEVIVKSSLKLFPRNEKDRIGTVETSYENKFYRVCIMLHPDHSLLTRNYEARTSHEYR